MRTSIAKAFTFNPFYRTRVTIEIGLRMRSLVEWGMACCKFRFSTIVLFGIIVSVSGTGISQNLVPNYSFEDTPCYGYYDDQEYIYKTLPWFSPNGKTTDVYKSCKSFSWLQTPRAAFGYQVPAHGEAYAGIRVFLDAISWNAPNYREYLAVKLIEPLKRNQVYRVSCKYNVGDHAQYATDDLGIYLSKTPIPHVDVLDYTPQIRNPEGNILTNTQDWETLGGSYVASGGEEYLVIGNFYDDAHTTMVRYNPGGAAEGSPYFYIDEVVVERTSLQMPEVDFGKDTTLCQGAQLLLDVTTDRATYLWQDHSTEPVRKVDAEGLYWVKVTVDDYTNVDSIYVRYQALPPLNLGKDALLCEGEKLLLNATTDKATYLWQDGTTNPVLEVTATGQYWVKVFLKNGCTVTDTINAQFFPIPRVELGPDTVFCSGGNITLDATFPNATYHWQDHSTNATLRVDREGMYWVEVAAHSCTFKDSVFVKQQECSFFIPNVITPNSDGINDSFVIRTDERLNIKSWHLIIYDRWGRLVYQTKDYKNDWRASDLNNGIYFYILRSSTAGLVYKGSISVLK